VCFCLLSQFSKDGLWVAFSKSNIIMATRLNSSYNQVGSQLKVGGVHKMLVSGKGSSLPCTWKGSSLPCVVVLCACSYVLLGISGLSPTSFVSSGLDGTIQTFSLDTRCATVEPCDVAMEKDDKGVACRGVAVSENCLLIAVVMK